MSPRVCVGSGTHEANPSGLLERADGERRVTVSKKNNYNVNYFCVETGKYEKGLEPSVGEAKERLNLIVFQSVNSLNHADEMEMYELKGIF